MQDDRLDSLLSDLPRERAQPDFTARVLAQLDRPQRRMAGPALVAVATAMAVVLVLALPRPHQPAGSTRTGSASSGNTAAGPASDASVPASSSARPAAARVEQRAEAKRLLAELQSEGAALEHDLHQLRQEQGHQVIYLGGDDDLDMVVDLHRVPTVQNAANHQ